MNKISISSLVYKLILIFTFVIGVFIGAIGFKVIFRNCIETGLSISAIELNNALNSAPNTYTF